MLEPRSFSSARATQPTIDVARLRALSSGSALGPFRLPRAVEAAYRRHSREQAAAILPRSVYGLIALYLLVVTPIALFSVGPGFREWATFAMAPIGTVLAVIWMTTRIAAMARHVETTLAIALFLVLVGTTYCAMRLGTAHFGQMAAYETIYILIVVFSVLNLPTRWALRWSLAAYVVAFTIATLQGIPPLWLRMMLYFGVPLLVCTGVGLLLEHSRRQAFVQNLCLHIQQRELSLLSSVADVANQVEDVEDGLAHGLEHVCTYVGFPLAHAFLVDAERESGLAPSVVHANVDGYERASTARASARVAERALATGAPSWSLLEASELAPSPDAGGRAPLRGALACPVTVGADVIAILVFFATTKAEPNEGLLSTIEGVTTKLGRVFERDKRQQRRLAHAALHDSLTRLPNRAYLLDQLRRSLALVRRRPTHSFGVLFLDVDRFKWVNDSFGHASGDRLLVEVAERLRARIGAHAVVARIGGDEFAILLDDVDATDHALDVAEAIHAALAAPFLLDGHDVIVSASVGIAIGNASYESPEAVLRDADTAMYHAKHRGRGGHALFESHMHEAASKRLRLATELRRAIETAQLRLHFQPIVELRSGLVAGFEALVRWQHPERGLLAPGEFVPLAEETGLVSPMTDWVLREACRCLGEWQRVIPGTSEIGVSVNMCARSFSDPAMPSRVFALIAEHAIAPGSLRLEITETQIMENAEAFARNLDLLASRNVHVYIDDFGTGYSSLSYLAELKVSALKIDRSFVHGLRRDGKEAIIVRSVIALAGHLGLDVIAEGIETDDQRAQLAAAECRYGQGYLFSRPTTADVAARLLREQADRELREAAVADA